MAKAKINRKELLKQDDAFLSAARDSAAWIGEHRFMVIGSSAAVVLVVSAIWGGTEYIRGRNLEASALLERAIVLSDAQIVEGEDAVAAPDAETPTFASEKDKQQALEGKLDETIAAAGGSGVGALARFYRGSLLEEKEDYEGAEKEFTALANELSTADNLYYFAIERAAYLHERRGDREGASELFERVASRDGGLFVDMALYHQGRLAQAAGKLTEARKLYERVETEFPDSMAKDEIEERLDAIGRTGSERAAALTDGTVAPSALAAKPAPKAEAGEGGTAVAEGTDVAGVANPGAERADNSAPQAPAAKETDEAHGP